MFLTWRLQPFWHFGVAKLCFWQYPSNQLGTLALLADVFFWTWCLKPCWHVGFAELCVWQNAECHLAIFALLTHVFWQNALRHVRTMALLARVFWHDALKHLGIFGFASLCVLTELLWPLWYLGFANYDKHVSSQLGIPALLAYVFDSMPWAMLVLGLCHLTFSTDCLKPGWVFWLC